MLYDAYWNSTAFLHCLLYSEVNIELLALNCNKIKVIQFILYSIAEIERFKIKSH